LNEDTNGSMDQLRAEIKRLKAEVAAAKGKGVEVRDEFYIIVACYECGVRRGCSVMYLRIANSNGFNVLYDYLLTYLGVTTLI